MGQFRQVALNIPLGHLLALLTRQRHMHQRCGALLLDKVDHKTIILVLTFLIGCDNVGQKHFESSRGWFELDYLTDCNFQES